MKNIPTLLYKFLLLVVIMNATGAYAQDAHVQVKADANKLMVGDQLRVFIEATNNTKGGQLQWAVIPDSFNTLEVIEKGKIDTTVNNGIATYKQRLLVTGFDSGVFYIPQFVFPVMPNGGNAYTIQTDSFPVLVQTVAVDTTKPFKGIKDIIYVKSTWLDYIWYIVGALIFIGLAAFVFVYFIKNKKIAAPVIAPRPAVETLQEQALRMIAALDKKQLWQQDKIKDYYTELTDIIRGYIEARFNTPAQELTTEELLHSVKRHHEMKAHIQVLSTIFYTADLAKFAKAQPMQHEHISTMEQAIQFVNGTKTITEETTAPKL